MALKAMETASQNTDNRILYFTVSQPLREMGVMAVTLFASASVTH